MLAPADAALLLEVTDTALALGNTASNGVLFVPFAPASIAFEGATLQARRQGGHVVVDVHDAKGADVEMHYFSEDAQGSALLVVAREVDADGKPGKPLFERRYARSALPSTPQPSPRNGRSP